MPKKKEVKKESKRQKTPKTLKGAEKVQSLSSKKNLKFFKIFLIFLLAAALLYYSKNLFLAAIVNGRPITRISLIKNLEKESGKTALENLIAKELISQEAKKKGALVNQEDIQKELEEIAKELEKEGTTLDAALSMRGVSREVFEENIKIQKMVEKLLEPELAVSEDEIKKYFEENKNFYGEEAKYEDLKNQISQQLKQEKLSIEYQKWFDELRGGSDVRYFLNF